MSELQTKILAALAEGGRTHAQIANELGCCWRYVSFVKCNGISPHRRYYRPHPRVKREPHPRKPNPPKTHCVHGHEFTFENTRWYEGRRICKACANRCAQTKRDATKKPRILMKEKISDRLKQDPSINYHDLHLELGCDYRYVKMVARGMNLPKRGRGRRRKGTVAEMTLFPTITPQSDPTQLPP